MTTEEARQKAWEKARVVRGKDPRKYRKDRFGNCMYRHSYGKHSPMGWQVDHWIPRSKGGGDTPRNRNAMSALANQKKADIHPRTKKFQRMWRGRMFYFDEHPACRPTNDLIGLGLGAIAKKEDRKRTRAAQ